MKFWPGQENRQEKVELVITRPQKPSGSTPAGWVPTITIQTYIEAWLQHTNNNNIAQLLDNKALAAAYCTKLQVASQVNGRAVTSVARGPFHH